MKFCKLFRFFDHTLQYQKARGVRKVFLKISQISQENTCVGVFFSKVECKFIKKRDSQETFCEICEIFKNAYFEEHLRTTASKLLFREKIKRGLLVLQIRSTKTEAAVLSCSVKMLLSKN